MELHRVLRVHRLIRHTHIRTKEQRRRITVMHPKRRPVRRMHVLSPQTAHRTHAIHVPLGLVRTAIITMRPIQHVHHLIATRL